MADERVIEQEDREKDKAREKERDAEGQAAEAGVESIPDLKAELESERAKAAEYLDGWQRARAEFANYRRRVEADRSEVHQNATGAVIARFLTILDDFDRAMRDRPKDGEAARWAEGIALIHRKFQNLLEAEGVKPIPVEGATFDPTLHEAVTHEDSDDHKEGEIIEEVRKGYKIGDRVLRPSLVRVAR